MKKSVIILIAVIYVASIALVSIYGLYGQVYGEQEILATGLEITDPNIYVSDGKKYVDIRADEDGNYTYKLTYKMTPEDATTADLEYGYDHESPAYTFDEETATVTFIEEGMLPLVTTATITVTVKGGTSDTLYVRAIRSR